MTTNRIENVCIKMTAEITIEKSWNDTTKLVSVTRQESGLHTLESAKNVLLQFAGSVTQRCAERIDERAALPQITTIEEA